MKQRMLIRKQMTAKIICAVFSVDDGVTLTNKYGEKTQRRIPDVRKRNDITRYSWWSMLEE
jgi:hypothetical protein